MLAWVDKRLRQVTGKLDSGWNSVIMFGDFRQLPPVGDSPLCAPPSTNDLSQQGYQVYHLFQKAVIDIGSSEKTAGITFVAVSRLPTLECTLIHEMPFERLQRKTTLHCVILKIYAYSIWLIIYNFYNSNTCTEYIDLYR